MPPLYANGPTAALGELAVLDGIGVRPLEVLEDSRCPASVQCVWAGRVRIRAEVSGAGSRELTLGEPVAVAVNWAQGDIEVEKEPVTVGEWSKRGDHVSHECVELD